MLVKRKEQKQVEPETAAWRDDADELHARRVVVLWAVIAVLLILVLALGFSLSKGDINRAPQGLLD
jgi:hypothetical protein